MFGTSPKLISNRDFSRKKNNVLTTPKKYNYNTDTMARYDKRKFSGDVKL